MARGPLTAAELVSYPRDGYVLARGLFDSREVGPLRRAAKEDKGLDDHSFGRADGEGGVVRLSLWNHPGDGIYGMFARCRSVVDTCELLLCYNAKRNDPYKESHHPRYTPLVKVEDSAILDAAEKRFAEAGDLGWLDPGRDASAHGLEKERR